MMVEKVLMIDDDEITLLLGEMVMEQNKFAHEIITLQDGQQGVDFYQELKNRQAQEDYTAQEAPKLILLDLNMPIMSGWEFLEEFSQHYQAYFPGTRVVILSSTIDPRDFARTAQYEFVVDFLHKPFSDISISSLRANQKLQGLFA